MNFLEHAYKLGAAAAKLAFTAPPPPKAGPYQKPATRTAMRPPATYTATTPATTVSGSAASPAASTSSATTLSGGAPVSAATIANNTKALTAQSVAEGTAEAGRSNIVGDRGGGTGVPAGATPKAVPYASTGTAGANPGAPMPARAGSTTVASGSKAAEFNMGMTPDPLSSPDKVPSPDNGRRMYGTQFSDALRPLRDVDQAFNALNIQKNTDVLNSAGQAEFGAPRG